MDDLQQATGPIDWWLRHGFVYGLGFVALCVFILLCVWVAVILIRHLSKWLPLYFEQKILESRELIKNQKQQTILLSQNTYMIQCLHENSHITLDGLREASARAYDALRRNNVRLGIDSDVVRDAEKVMKAFRDRPTKKHQHEPADYRDR